MPADEGGDAAREAFQKELDDAFTEANTSNDGILDKDQFRFFCERMD